MDKFCIYLPTNKCTTPGWEISFKSVNLSPGGLRRLLLTATSNIEYFEIQLEETKNINIPGYLNTRNSVGDAIKILKKYEGKFPGIFHSFDGSVDKAKQILDFGFYISINGWYFEIQLEETKNINIPGYLNTRNSVGDAIKILKKYEGKFPGIFHSFDGSVDKAKQILDFGFYISINGCSVRTEEALLMVKSLSLDRIILESNSPWCLLKPLRAGYKYVRTTYPARAKFHWSPDSMVRGRNEPSNINQVLEVVATVKEQNPDDICETLFKNAQDLYFPGSQGGDTPDAEVPPTMVDDDMGEPDLGGDI